MEITIDADVVKSILLDWAGKTLPGAFNKVTFDGGYSSLQSATLLFEPIEPPEPLKVHAPAPDADDSVPF